MRNTKVKLITKSKQFSYIKKKANKLVYKPFIILFLKEEQLDFFQVGFIVSSKVGKSVTRNKVKRWLKNISIGVLNELDANGFSVCIIARSSICNYKFDKVKDLFANAVQKITS